METNMNFEGLAIYLAITLNRELTDSELYDIYFAVNYNIMAPSIVNLCEEIKGRC